MPERRQQVVDDALDGGDMHGRRIGVVRRLAHIDVIVGMHRLLRAHDAAQHLDRPVGDHLVGVHVRLRARAGLPDDQREMVVELAVDHLLRGLDDRLADLRVEPLQFHVGFGSGALDDAERTHDGERLLLPAYLEIAERALRLRAPIAVGRHFDRAERVCLGARSSHLVLPVDVGQHHSSPIADRHCATARAQAIFRSSVLIDKNRKGGSIGRAPDNGGGTRPLLLIKIDRLGRALRANP